jgi:hypothetical protein
MSHKHGVILKSVESHCSGSDCSNDILSFLCGGVLFIKANRSNIRLKVQFLFLFSPPHTCFCAPSLSPSRMAVVVHKVHQGLSEFTVSCLCSLPLSHAILAKDFNFGACQNQTSLSRAAVSSNPSCAGPTRTPSSFAVTPRFLLRRSTNVWMAVFRIYICSSGSRKSRE